MSNTKLNTIVFGVNEYCGPSVLSALTGKTTDECAEVISHLTGRNVIKGVQMDVLIKALERLRFDCEKMNVPAHTVFGTLNAISGVNGLYIIGVPGHVVAVEVAHPKIYLIDNHTKQAISASASARLSQKVDGLYRVKDRGEKVLISIEISVEKDYHHVTIWRSVKYSNARDNVLNKLGTLYFKNDAEFADIVSELSKCK